MNTTYFSTCTTADAIKAEYRRLCRIHHPDLGGDTRTMQAINAAYDAACKAAQRVERPDKSEKAYDFYADADIKVREAIARIITLPQIEIEVCGWWVWVGGDTRAVKDQLKAAQYRWSPKKAMWYYPGCPSTSKGTKDMDAIRRKYGSQHVATQAATALNAE